MSRKGILTSTLQMMPNVAEDDLRLFMHALLRTDKDTQLRFIVRFADELDMQEAERYEWLFYKLFQSVRHTSDGGLNITQQRKLAALYGELLEQGKDALVRHHFLKTYHICVQGLIKIRIIHQRSKDFSDVMASRYHDYLQLLYALFEARLPPALTDEMHDFITDEYEHEISNKENADYSLLRLWMRLKYRLEGSDCFKQDAHLFSIEHYDALEDCERFYETVLSEPWADAVWATIASYRHPAEILRHVLRRLSRRGEDHIIARITKYLSDAPVPAKTSKSSSS